MDRARATLLAALIAVLAAAASGARAAGTETYPNRPLRIVVPYLPGGTTDILARALAPILHEALAQPIVIDNRPGASGMIGADLVAKASPDGYTALMATVAEVAINQSLYPKMAYDPVKDLAPVTLAGITPLILVIHPSIPASSVNELVAFARGKQGGLTFASPGNGSVQHLSGELVKTVARIDLLHVPYKGAPPALADLLGGQVSIYFSGMPPVMPHVKAGRLRALAVTTVKRSPAAPDIPTMAEAGMPGFDISNWFGVFVPAATPRDRVVKLNREISKALQRQDVKERLADQGLETVGNSTEQFSAFFKAEIAKYAGIIKASGARAD